MVRDIDVFCKELYDQYKTNTCIVACSGGMDSMLLLHLLRKANLTPIAVHINYQLRGVDSDLDQRCVEEYCKKFNLSCISECINLSKSSGSIQLVARNKRYQFFELMQKRYPNSLVFIAHHLEDQVETFFLQLSRGAGIKGMAGMQHRTSIYCRPLIHVSKGILKEWAIKENLVWREDKSNQESKYARNKLRNILLPEMMEEIPDLKESVLLLQSVFRKNHTALHQEIKKLTELLLNGAVLEEKDALQLEEYQWAELLDQLGMKFSMLPEIIKLRRARVGAKLKIAKNTFLMKESNGIVLAKEKDVHSIVRLQISELTELPAFFSLDEVYLDPNRIVGELNIATWQDGDVIYPVGMKGKSLVSNVIKDAKIPFLERKKHLVVRDDKYIHWIPGVKVGRMALATITSQKILVRLINE